MNNSNRYIVIMAGGVGSRFWPASREDMPKQFLDITGSGTSLLQMTYIRACKIVPKQNVLISSNKKYRSLILEQLSDISDNQLLLEPSRNNTAPCIAFAAIKINAQNPAAVFAVLPSDHAIAKEDIFAERLNQAFEFAESNDGIVTLGIEATRPDTGYGYIETDKSSNEQIKTVTKFKEKPDLPTAESYLKAGNYYWNGGIFIWSTQTILTAFGTHAKQIVDVLSEDLSQYNTPNEQAYIDRVYPNTDKESVDYAILEKSENVYTIPVDMGWSDLGTWASLHDYLPKNDEQNVGHSNTDILDNVSNCLIRKPNNKMLVMKDLEDYIVIDEDDVLMIYPKAKEQEIKALRKKIKDEKYL